MYLTTIEESIRDILITPLGSRVMLPEYGSKLFELVDRKVDDEFRAKLTLYVKKQSLIVYKLLFILRIR